MSWQVKSAYLFAGYLYNSFLCDVTCQNESKSLSVLILSYQKKTSFQQSRKILVPKHLKIDQSKTLL